MNVTVFGATGAIGKQVVDQLRSRGHAVTAYVRNPGKLPATWGEDVAVVVGEITDAAAIDRAVAGADAVVSALGPSLSRSAIGLPLVEGTELIVAAMQRTVCAATSATAPRACSTPASAQPGRPGCPPSWPRRSCAAPTTSCSA
jgi:uncharacterized protein YbjT (DUF2867 family)